MKINKQLHKRLILQAEEAKNLGLVKLASDVNSSIDEVQPSEVIEEYSYDQMKSDISKDVWKMASRLFSHYQIKNIDISEFNKIVQASADNILNDLQEALSMKDAIGKAEPKVFGEE